jgi:hypothetical protein
MGTKLSLNDINKALEKKELDEKLKKSIQDKKKSLLNSKDIKK